MLSMTFQEEPKGGTARIGWIDFCRAYAAFFVIVRHVHPVRGTMVWFADELTYRGLIFLFFFLSGYFVHAHKEACGLKKYIDSRRFFQLLWAYLFWSAMGVVLLVPLYHYESIVAGDFSFISLSALGDWMGLNPPGPHTYPLNVPLWFLKNLMVLALFAPLLYNMNNKILIVLVLASLACGEILLTVDTGDHSKEFAIEAIPGRTYENLMSVGFFSLGIIVRRSFSLAFFDKFIKDYAWLPITAALLLFPMVHFWGFFPPCKSCELVAISVLMIMSISALCEKYCPAVFKLVARYGPAMMFVYTTHYIVLQYLQLIIRRSNNYLVCTLQEMALPVMALCICLAFYHLLTAHFPSFMHRFAFVKPNKGTHQTVHSS